MAISLGLALCHFPNFAVTTHFLCMSNQSNPPKYLYITECLIPNLLWDKIKEFPEKKQFKYAFIASFINVLSREDERFHNANINRKVWDNALGSGYRRYIDNLLAWGIIDIQLNERGGESYEKGGHCKCYSLTPEVRKGGFILKDFKKRKAVVNTTPQNIRKNAIDVQDPIIKYTLESIGGTHIKNTTQRAISEDEALDDICDRLNGDYWKRKLDTQNYSIHYGGSCGRLYHPIICMPKTARKDVWFNNSEVVMDYDIKTCFPVLLMSFVPEPEREKYKNLLDGDIYEFIIKDSKHNRKHCKKAFQQFINGFVKNYVHDWFAIHFPQTLDVIQADYANTSKKLQTLESSIMIQGLIPFLISRDINGIILCHDGWLTWGNAETDAVIVEFVKSEVEKV
ncbi:MAG: hypothetical protein WCP19_08925, partial [Chloroflexota bacterium]